MVEEEGEAVSAGGGRRRRRRSRKTGEEVEVFFFLDRVFVVFFFFSVRSQQKRLAVRAAGASIRQDSFSRGSRASQFHSPSHLAQRCARGGREQARCNHHRRRRRRRRKKAAADIRHLSSSDAGEPAPGLMVLRRGSQAASQQQGREEPRGHPLSLSFFLLARRRKGEREREREREEAKRKECEGRRLDQRALRRKKKSLSKKRREGKKKNPSSSSRSSPLRATPSRSHGTFPDPGGEARPSLYPGDCRMAPGALALALRARALHRVGKKKRRRKKKKKKKQTTSSKLPHLVRSRAERAKHHHDHPLAPRRAESVFLLANLF